MCIDGPGGSGKSTLAAALADLDSRDKVVHMDDLFAGWEGLGRVDAQLAALLTPLSQGRPGRYRRYDWHAGAFAETVQVDPVPLVVLEGVGSGHRATAHLASLLVWVWVPAVLRLARGLARDGEQMSAHWADWMAAEDDHYERDQTSSRADLVVDGTGAEPPAPA